MTALRDLQSEFSAFIWGRQAAGTLSIVPNGVEPEQRWAIYRNNTLLGLRATLRDIYPVIAKLVGERFFTRLCESYIGRHQPATGCLQTFGEKFPDFLADFPDAAGLPYLPDTARLEWLRHQVYFEYDQAGIDAAALAAVPKDCYGALRFRLHPSVRLLSSDYPVLRIWQSNQPDHPDEGMITLEQGDRLLIHRSGWEVEMFALEESQYRFLTALQSGQTLGDAAAGTLQDDAGFDLASLLRICLSRALFGDFFPR